MLNRIVLVGRLVKDPELRKTGSDLSVANITLAVDNTIKEADGTRGTCFLDAKVFGDKAENLCKYTRKGSKVAVDGSINQRNFERKDGTKGKAIEILIDSVEFLDPKQEEPKEPNVDDLPFKGEEAKPQAETPKQEPKFDPYTGKALTPKAKKK